MCCKALAVYQLGKPVGQWCPHCEINRGCTIYSTRPQECAAFECLWLQGLLPEQDRPDRLHAVFFLEPASADPGAPLIVVVSESYPGAATRRPRIASIIAQYLKRGQTVVVRNAEYVETHRPGAPTVRQPVDSTDLLRVRVRGQAPSDLERRLTEQAQRLNRSTNHTPNDS
jgi:hypothetical protein